MPLPSTPSTTTTRPRWCFDVELIRLAQLFKVPVAEVAVNWTEVDGSKLHAIYSSIRMAYELCMLGIGYNVVRVWTAVDPRTALSGSKKGR